MTTRTVTTTHKWQIDNVSQKISTSSELLVSGVLSMNDNSGTKLLMSLGRGNTNYHDLHLICTEFGQNRTLSLRVKGWYENNVGLIGNRQEVKTLPLNEAKRISLFGSYLTSDLRAFSTVLFICIEIQYQVPIVKCESDNGLNELVDRNEFGQKMLKLHSDGISDLTIQVGGKEFKANKFTLMAYSEVFKVMLQSPNSAEAKSGIIKMENTKPGVIEALIRWIYQAKIDNTNEVAIDLYQTADKYQIGLLKKVCAKVMTKQLSNENVPSRLIMAYNNNEAELKKAIIEFLASDRKNMQSLMASSEWLKYGGEYHEQAKKIVADIYA